MIDSIVKKGAFHRSMPQDYVVAEDLGTAKQPFPFIAVADGCSAGLHSEIGAMIFARAALASVKYHIDRLGLDTPGLGMMIQDTLEGDILARAKEAAGQLKLELDDMIATLRVAFLFDGIIYTMESGDGYNFFVQGEDFDMDRYEYEINAPFYLAYKMFGKVREYDGIGINHLVQTHYDSKNPIKNFVSTFDSHHIFMQQHALEFYPNATYFGLATDGLGTYMRDDGSNLVVKPEIIVAQLSQIKIPAGAFFVRRFQKMDAELTSKGFVNQDDIGIACVSIHNYKETLKHNTEAKS